MNAFDWTIVAVYLSGVVGLSVFVGRGQTDEVDYYVGGRSLPWWAVGISTMATQTSVISFISIPAFVAIKEGGGLTWLQYELAVPLAMIMVMVVLLPFFRKLELISVYEYLEMRFSPRVRLLISGIFLSAAASAPASPSTAPRWCSRSAPAYRSGPSSCWSASSRPSTTPSAA